MAQGKLSAGLLLFRRGAELEVFLVHPGGPFWAKKDAGAWTIPKGLPDSGENLLASACREFQEETGFKAHGPFLPLGAVPLKSGKVVHAWAFEGDVNPAELHSNEIEVEWPPRSRRTMTIPEVDRGEWFSLATAREKINPAQSVLLNRLTVLLEQNN